MARIGSSITLPEAPKPVALPLHTATIVNITDTSLPIRQFTYGNYSVPVCERGFQTLRHMDGHVERIPCEIGDEWAAAKVGAARLTINYGDKRTQESVIEPRDICLDISRQCNGDIWGLGNDTLGDETVEAVRGFMGVFVADGDIPTEQELIEMRDILRLADVALVQEGHKTWDQFGKPDYIHEGFKRAARRIGVQADWLYTIYNMPDCPHCGSRLKSTTATVCATCHRDVKPQLEGARKGKAGKAQSQAHEAA